jgi:outer membrane protein
MLGLFSRKSLAIACLAIAGQAQSDTLLDIYELALQNDPTLKAAEASYKALRENKNLGRSALLPQINAQGEYTKSDSDNSRPQFTGSFVQLTTNNETTTKNYGITLNQNLFDLSAWFSFKQGKELSKQAEAQFAFDQQDLIIRVAEAYFNVLRAKDNLATNIAEEKAIERQLEQTQQRFDVGLIAITDVHEARAAHDLARVTRLEAEGNLGIAREALTVLTGQAAGELWSLKESLPIASPDPVERAEWVDFALKQNMQIRAAFFAAEAAHQNAKAKKAEHLPKLTGNISYFDNSDDTESSGFDPDTNQPFDVSLPTETDGHQFGVTLNVPIFSGGRVSASRRQAYQEYMRAYETHIGTQRNIIQLTRSQHLQVVTDVGKVSARKQAITSAQSALDATQAGYEVGTRNIVDVLDAQRFLYRALFNYSNARYDYVVNMLKLKQAAGTLSPADISDLSSWLEVATAPTASSQPK